MITKVYNYIKNLFNYVENDKREDKEKWVEKKLNKWKVDLYCSNSYLNDIPSSRIYNQRKIFEKEFDKNNK